MRRATFVAVVVAALVLAALVAGCGDGDDDASGPPPTSTTGTATAPASTTTAPTEPSTATGPAEPVTIQWPPVGLLPDQTPVLRTPTGNIECAVEPSAGFGVVCNAYEHQWTLPPKPADCGFEWTDAIYLPATGPPEFWCSSNPAFGPEGPSWPRTEFRYDARVAGGGLECTSSRSGVRCTNREGRGFFLSRERVDFF